MVRQLAKIISFQHAKTNGSVQKTT
uniref:Uncharacterized protein n=1 Tax=Rhizophora mucronata TaxID=61149 RepID=A0A2P2QWU1_RHIMU